MKITITGSLGNIGTPLAQTLTAAGHQVTIITSSADRVAQIQALGATAAVGSVADVDFLTQAFTGADVVYAMVPPNLGAPDVVAYMAQTGENYAEAIRRSGVTRVVYLSSIGAHLPDGNGPIAGHYHVEHTLNQLENVAVKHIRAPFFYFNFFANIDMIKHMGIIGSNYPASVKLILIHAADAANAIVEELTHNFTGKSVRYIVSDERTAADVASVLGAAVGKPELPWVEFTDEQSVAGMQQAGLSASVAKLFTEMGAAVRSGDLWQDYNAHRPAPTSNRNLEAFAKEFAAVYNG